MNTRTTLVISTLALATGLSFAAASQVASSGAAAPAPAVPPAPLEKKVPAGTAEEVRETIVTLQRLAGFDAARDLLTLPYRGETIDALVEAAWAPALEVRNTALHLLALAVRQLDLPDEALYQRILPALRGIAETAARPRSAEDQRTVELARRVLWHAEIRGLTHPGQRLEALAAALDDRRDGYYYPIEALSYLAEMGTDDARRLLETKLAESEHRSLSPKLLARVRATIEKVDLQLQLRTLGSEAQVAALTDALIASLPDRSLPARDFQIWVVRQLGDRKTEAANQVLSRVAADDTLFLDLRYEAEREVRSQRENEVPRK